MKYKVGSLVPQEEILKRYKDEDGEIFLELRGNPDVYFRVNAEGQVYYQIEKDLMQGEEMNLLDDFTDQPLLSAPSEGFNVQPPDLSSLSDFSDTVSDMGGIADDFTGSVSSATLEAEDSRAKEKTDVVELEEGERAPAHLIEMCKPNHHGGYSLRFNKFLYILNGDYRVDVKTPDASFAYDFGDPTEELDQQEIAPPGSSGPTEPEPAPDGTFNKGDILPEHLRGDCEEDISSVGGHRLLQDKFLYLLDEEYRVTTRMKLSFSEPEEPLPEPEPPQPPPKPVSMAEAVDNLLDIFDKGLDEFGISADYFKETVCKPRNRETLYSAFNGDLTHLNEDMREASMQGKSTVLEEKGFTLFKAVLVHELYIKSTLSGRGENMKYFLTRIIQAEPDGSVTDVPDAVSLNVKSEMMEYFKSRAKDYSDKTEIFVRVYRHLAATAVEEYEQINQGDKKLLFSAYLIMKLYQQTTRLDRREGLSVIGMVRDLMDYL